MTCGSNEIQFWLKDFSYLFCSLKLVPKSSMGFYEQLNCLTRLILLIFFILWFFGYKNAIFFLIISLGIIIILYIIKSKTMIENYTKQYNEPLEKRLVQNERLYLNSAKNLSEKFVTKPLYATSFYKEQAKNIPIYQNQNFQSTNQRLVGPANPKTKQAPLTVAPPMDLSYWKNSDLTTMSQINSRSAQDFYYSGYYTTPDTCKQDFETEIKEEYRYDPPIRRSNSDASYRENVPYYEGNRGNIFKVSLSNGPDPTNYGQIINDIYAPHNTAYDLPPNYNASSSQLNNDVKSLNDQIFTSIISPGMYYKTEIVEPISSNIGISFTQQLPQLKITDSDGKTSLTAKDPLTFTQSPLKLPQSKYESVSPYDIEDPRSFGYGTSYRNYVDDLTGQPRFLYDDIEAVRRPNYISRSKIDHLVDNITYGTMPTDQEFYENNKDSRRYAEKSFADQTVEFRSSLMTSLMRKNDANAWQQKIMPLTGNKQMTLGGMGLRG
jgi:hypothetical protein